jgi:hypothetical protein
MDVFVADKVVPKRAMSCRQSLSEVRPFIVDAKRIRSGSESDTYRGMDALAGIFQGMTDQLLTSFIVDFVVLTDLACGPQCLKSFSNLVLPLSLTACPSSNNLHKKSLTRK